MARRRCWSWRQPSGRKRRSSSELPYRVSSYPVPGPSPLARRILGRLLELLALRGVRRLGPCRELEREPPALSSSSFQLGLELELELEMLRARSSCSRSAPPLCHPERAQRV